MSVHKAVEEAMKQKNKNIKKQKIQALQAGDDNNPINSDEFSESDEVGENKEKYNYYNDSDLESQMDDFKISEKS